MRRLAIAVRERRALLLGGSLIAALLAGARGLPVWRGWREEVAASAAEMIAEAERAEQSVFRLAATLDSLEQRRDRLVALSPALVGGGTPSSAAAALAARISAAAATAHVQLGAVHLQVDSAGAGVFTRVSVRAGATGDVRGIVRLLADLERGPPLLAIREWSISQSDPAAPAHQAEELRLEVLVEGLALNRRAETAP